MEEASGETLRESEAAWQVPWGGKKCKEKSKVASYLRGFLKVACAGGLSTAAQAQQRLLEVAAAVLRKRRKVRS